MAFDDYYLELETPVTTHLSLKTEIICDGERCGSSGHGCRFLVWMEDEERYYCDLFNEDLRVDGDVTSIDTPEVVRRCDACFRAEAQAKN